MNYPAYFELNKMSRYNHLGNYCAKGDNETIWHGSGARIELWGNPIERLLKLDDYEIVYLSKEEVTEFFPELL